jgi:alpha-D-xyloside xylohydrolase
LAAPYPFVLYSDLYDHQVFINSIAQSGFCGLLWMPEVRHATNTEDLIRRLQSAAFSPLMMVNAWYLKMPPWLQMDRKLNNEGVVDAAAAELEAQCRYWINLRMQLVPYIHAAFVKYQKSGIPPFRALILDYPEEKEALKDVNGQYMMGDNIMVAPITADRKSVSVYLPKGVWYDFFTNERIEGGRKLTVSPPVDRMPVYVKEGTILPLAKPTNSTEAVDSRRLAVRVYGNRPAPFTLYEDDGMLDTSLKEIIISRDTKQIASVFYTIDNTVIIQ